MLFSSARRASRAAAERLYTCAVAAARDPTLYRDYGVPDTLQGRFEMVALHLFPLIHRLMHEPGDDPELARRVSESFVADMDATFREMGVSDLSVPKRMTTLYRAFAGRTGAYVKALAAGRPALVAAIARNVLPERADDGSAAALAAHVEATVAALQAARLDDVRRGEVSFPSPAPLPQTEPAG